MYGSENPGVFTDARCFMDWISGQYNMRMPSNYIKPPSCFDHHYADSASTTTGQRIFGGGSEEVTAGIGDINDIDKDECHALFDYWYQDPSLPERENWVHKTESSCVFNQSISSDGNNRTRSRCRIEGSEGFSYNIYQCQDERGKTGICANNCRGVNPNSIIIGGLAPVFAFAAGQAFLQPALLGAAGLGAGAIGVGAAMGVGPSISGQCPNTRPCRVRESLY